MQRQHKIIANSTMTDITREERKLYLQHAMTGCLALESRHLQVGPVRGQIHVNP